MAKKFLTGLTLVNLDSDPLVGSEGELYFNTSASVAKIYKSGAWTELGAGGGGGGAEVTISETAPSSPSVGDLWYQASTGSFSVWDGTYWVEINSIIEYTISQEEVQDYVAPLLEHSNHTNISASYDDLNNQILLSTSASVTSEQIQDAIAPLFTHSSHTNISATYDDLENKILLAASATYTDEDAMDAVAGMITSGTHTNITVSYDDSLNTLSFTAAPGYTNEEAVDAVALALTSASSSSINVTYDDLNNKILLEVGEVGSGITVGNTAPTSPNIGDGWYNNETGSFYLYDGTYWVEVNGIIDGLTEDQVQDYVAPLFTHSSHTNVTATYDDANNKIILNTSQNLTSIDSVQYPDYIAFDTTPETSSASVGTLFWDSGDGVPKAILSANVQLGIGQESVALVKNATGSSIPKGTVVYINGAQGQRPTVTLSSASTEVTSSKTFGFTAETIANGAEGFVVTEGIIRGVNTGGLTQGGPLWLSVTSGQYTQTMPTQPNHSVFLGYVVKAHASSGEIFVKIQNGYELQELHNVKITDVQDQDLIVYSSASGLWINTTNQSIINSASAAAVSAASGIFATQAYVNEISDITPLDNIKSKFDGFETRFLPTYLGDFINITNPYRLILNINGIIQVVDYPELVWQSPLPRQGFWIDNEGYIVFSEAPPPGSTFDARLMAGSTTTTKTKLLYPFEPVDILLGE